MSLCARNGRKTSLVALAADYPLDCVRKKVWAQHIGEHSRYYGTVGASGGRVREGEKEKERGRERERERGRGRGGERKRGRYISIETVIANFRKYSFT